MIVEVDLVNMFNWIIEEVEICDKGVFCQEIVLMIKVGIEIVILVMKGCILDGEEVIIIVQYFLYFGLIVIFYSNYCEDFFCNDKDSLFQFWEFSEIIGILEVGEIGIKRNFIKSVCMVFFCILIWFSISGLYFKVFYSLSNFIFLNCLLGFKYCLEQRDISKVGV